MSFSQLLKYEKEKFCFSVLKLTAQEIFLVKVTFLSDSLGLIPMATFPESTSQGFPSDGNPGPFPSFGNVGAPYMETLSLPGLTTGLPVWLFSTSVIPSVSTPTRMSPSFESWHDDI